MLIWPEASSAQNNMAAVSADRSTICVLILRLNSSCRRSIAFVVRTLRHWGGGRRVKVKSRSPDSAELSATARCLSRHLRMKALRRVSISSRVRSGVLLALALSILQKFPSQVGIGRSPARSSQHKSKSSKEGRRFLCWVGCQSCSRQPPPLLHASDGSTGRPLSFSAIQQSFPFGSST
jgi:hypothetical protein